MESEDYRVGKLFNGDKDPCLDCQWLQDNILEKCVDCHNYSNYKEPKGVEL